VLILVLELPVKFLDSVVVVIVNEYCCCF